MSFSKHFHGIHNAIQITDISVFFCLPCIKWTKKNSSISPHFQWVCFFTSTYLHYLIRVFLVTNDAEWRRFNYPICLINCFARLSIILRTLHMWISGFGEINVSELRVSTRRRLNWICPFRQCPHYLKAEFRHHHRTNEITALPNCNVWQNWNFQWDLQFPINPCKIHVSNLATIEIFLFIVPWDFRKKKPMGSSFRKYAMMRITLISHSAKLSNAKKR